VGTWEKKGSRKAGTGLLSNTGGKSMKNRVAGNEGTWKGVWERKTASNRSTQSIAEVPWKKKLKQKHPRRGR